MASVAAQEIALACFQGPSNYLYVITCHGQVWQVCAAEKRTSSHPSSLPLSLHFLSLFSALSSSLPTLSALMTHSLLPVCQSASLHVHFSASVPSPSTQSSSLLQLSPFAPHPFCKAHQRYSLATFYFIRVKCGWITQS